MDDYLVSLNVLIEADSPEGAAQELIKWIEEDGPGIWVYAVEHEDTNTIVMYDAESGKVL